MDAGNSNEADYFYDANNWRVKKTTSNNTYTTYYIWESGQVIAEYGNAPGGGSGNSYYLADRLSNRMITDNGGAFKGTQDHLPFGEEGGTSQTSEKHRFTNYERDSESGTDYALNRQYQMNSGRYTQPDKASGSIGDPQSLNRYAYSLNDPVNVADPSGLFPDVPEQFTAGNGGSGIYWDGIRLMITEYEMVYRFWQSGAVDIMPQGAQLNKRGDGWIIPTGEDSSIDVSDLNDLWRLLTVSFSDSKHPCGAMADRAQTLANQAMKQAGGANSEALELFDHAFSQAYIGNNGTGTTLWSAWRFLQSGIHPQVPFSQQGEEDFKPEFKEGNKGDQTHHFAAYLSAGINDQNLPAMLHMWGTDFNNKADRALGWKAFGFGEALAEDPVFLKVAGQYIRKFICE